MWKKKSFGLTEDKKTRELERKSSGAKSSNSAIIFYSLALYPYERVPISTTVDDRRVGMIVKKKEIIMYVRNKCVYVHDVEEFLLQSEDCILKLIVAWIYIRFPFRI